MVIIATINDVFTASKKFGILGFSEEIHPEMLSTWLEK
jgi:hypothetical protein